MLFNVSKTYEIWDKESIELGETDDRGFEYEDNKLTLKELINEIKNNGFNEVSCWPWRNLPNHGYKPWLSTVDPYKDMVTGDVTNYSLHIDTSNRNLVRIFKLAGIK